MVNYDAGRGFIKVVLQLLAGILFLAAIFFAFIKFGPFPVAAADSPLPLEKLIARTAVRARVGREMKQAPFAASRPVLESGARVYHDHQCGFCHGFPGEDSPFSRQMFPPPPQLWKKHGRNGAVGISEEPVGFAYWAVSHGIRLSGMPSFEKLLSDTEIWQVSLLLKNANQPMPDPVKQILSTPKQNPSPDPH